MQKSSKAAFLSFFILPGAGHFFLKCYARGSVLFLVAAFAIFVVTSSVVEQAQLLIDKATREGATLDISAISEIVSDSLNQSESYKTTVAITILGICWLIGVVDSYRIGRTPETLQK